MKEYAPTPLSLRRVHGLGWTFSLLGVSIVPAVFFFVGWTDLFEIPPDLRPEMVLISVGTLEPYAIARTEVTQEMFLRVMGYNPSEPAYLGVSLLGSDLPVQNVTWLESLQYCNRLSVLEERVPAYSISGDHVEFHPFRNGYRLPSPSEWWYAASAGSSSGCIGGMDACSSGNVADSSAKAVFPGMTALDCDDGVVGLAPVGSYRANPWGLYDMTGNVLEWAWLPGAPKTERRTDKNISVKRTVNPCGSWRTLPFDHESGAWPDTTESDDAFYFVGFRIARSVPGSPTGER